MKKHLLFAAAAGCMASLCPLTEIKAQKIPIEKISTDAQLKARMHLSAKEFPALNFTKIKGAPTLSYPTLVETPYGPVEGRGMGWAYPELRDMDGDGKKDLLVGEFGSGMENGYPVGNFIRVYPNISKDSSLVFGDNFSYLRGDSDYGFGTPLSLYVWCCMGFKPTFVDLDHDGFMDIIAGQYYPGDLIWFRGTKKGFLYGERVFQEGEPLGKKKPLGNDDLDPNDGSYWYYNTLAVADLTGDGLEDLVIGGGALRLSKNIGTKEQPKFALRKSVLYTDGTPVASYKHGDTTGGHANPVLFDWDNDGVLDLLATYSYLNNKSEAIIFYKGVKQNGEYRVQKGIPLFTAKDGGKSLPGSHPSITITDWNGDGVMDILMGLAIATRNEKYDPELSWKWEIEAGIFQLNPGYYSEPYKRDIQRRMDASETHRKKIGLSEAAYHADPKYLSKEKVYSTAYVKPEYKTLKHVGYVYVFLGKK
jgi:hypothetical protein